MKIIKTFAFVILVLVVLFGIFLGYFSLTDYNPEERILIFKSDEPDTLNAENLNLSFLCWNIGYENFQLSAIENNYLPDTWSWLYDETIPTNRSLKAPYDPELTSKTILDFYLISPNLKCLGTRTQDLEFENADHQPVFTIVQLVP